MVFVVVDLWESNFEGSDFSFFIFIDVVFFYVSLWGVNLSGFFVDWVILDFVDLWDIIFIEAIVICICFYDIDIIGVDFSDVVIDVY